jgi:tripartite-type tricarboxylate transporter receptor subunit TctC
MPLISAGRVRPLAVSTDKRTAELPNVPTVAESGYPGFNLAGWTVLAAPQQTPQVIVDKLREAMLSLYKNPAYQAKIKSLGLQTQELTGKDLDSFVASELARMKELAKKANITPE